MDTQTKTPVEIVQELIAIHTTRKEAVAKLKLSESSNAQAATADQQSDQFIAALMNELSTFGDAVQSEAGRENDYQTTYKKMLAEIDTMSTQQHEQTFQELEEKLKAVYQTILETKNDLPESLQKILTEQKEQL